MRSRLPSYLLALALVAVGVPVFAFAADAPKEPRRDPVGRPLGDRPGPVMEPVAVGARFTHVAAVAGSADDEAWATAYVDRFPGSDGESTDAFRRISGNEAFYVHRRGDGWRFAGIPRSATGESLASTGSAGGRGSFRLLALGPSGAGWAVRRLAGAGDEMYRLDRTSGDWIRDEVATALLNPPESGHRLGIRSLSLGRDEQGDYGFGVVEDPASDTQWALRLEFGQWRLETVVEGGVLGGSPSPSPSPSVSASASPSPGVSSPAVTPSGSPPESPSPSAAATPSASPSPSLSPTASAAPSPSTAPTAVPSVLPTPPAPPALPTRVLLKSVAVSSRERAWIVAAGSEGVATFPVLLRRSAPNVWERVHVDDPMFDKAEVDAKKSVATRFVFEGAPGLAVAASGNDVWFTGTIDMVDLTTRPLSAAPRQNPPLDNVNSLDRTLFGTTGTLRQSYAVHHRDGAATKAATYCPVVPRVEPDGKAAPVTLCARSLPALAYVSQVTAIDGRVILTGQTGLLRDTRDDTGVTGFVREPATSVAVAESAFVTADEGWLVARSGSVISNTAPTWITGHWTTRPRTPAFRRWATPATQPLDAVAVDPSGSKRAVAVGDKGTVLLLTPGVGWDVVGTTTTASLHAVAWETSRRAWAVGDGGTVVRIDVPDGLAPTAVAVAVPAAAGRMLTGVAFGDDGGWAVGHGVVLHESEGVWSADATLPEALRSATLNAVALSGGELLVAADQARLGVRGASGWSVVDLAPLLPASGGSTPDLSAVAGLPDGRAYVGGATGALLQRRGVGQRFTANGLPPLDGWVQSLVAVADDFSPRVLATVGERSCRFASCGSQYGQTYLFERGRWRDLGTGRVPSLQSGMPVPVDSPVVRDPVRALALDPASGFRRGWAVGGLAGRVRPITQNAEGELFSIDGHADPSYPTSSVWRFDTDEDATPEPSPAEGRLARLAPPDTIGFAFLGDSHCVVGLCNLVEGAGSRADMMLGAALDDVSAAAREGTVGFIAHAGNLRGLGVTDDVAQVVRAFGGAGDVPWYGALGERELLAQAVNVGTTGAQATVAVTAEYALRVLNEMPRPWGHATLPRGIRPVAVSETSSERPDLARTHYAFDYAPDGGAAQLRVAVLDTSRSMLTDGSVNQNPSEPQLAWLGQVLAGACTEAGAPGACVPTVVVMHRPLHNQVADSADGPEASAVTPVLTGPAGATLVLAGKQARNRAVAGVPDATPQIVVSGTLGGRLDPDQAERGGYPAWQLVTLDPAARTPAGRGVLSVRSIPVIESLALSAPRGRAVAASRTLSFSGIGRVPDAGSGAPEAYRTTATGGSRSSSNGVASGLVYNGLGGPPYLHFPTTANPLDDVATPDYRFRCVDARICSFVRRDPLNPSEPLLSNPLDPTSTTDDPASGLMCAREAGSTAVELVSGYRTARMPITITPGEGGPCSAPKEPRPAPEPSASAPPEPPAEPPAPAPGGDPVPEPQPAPEPVPAPPTVPDPVAEPAPEPAPVPVPAPVPLPAPVPEPAPALQFFQAFAPLPVAVPVPAPGPAPFAQFLGLTTVVPGAPPVSQVPPAQAMPAPPGGATVSVSQPMAAVRREESVEAAIARADLHEMTAYQTNAHDPEPLAPLVAVWAAAAGLGAAAGAGARRRNSQLRPAYLSPDFRRSS